jgi:hypothetical protein
MSGRFPPLISGSSPYTNGHKPRISEAIETCKSRWVRLASVASGCRPAGCHRRTSGAPSTGNFSVFGARPATSSPDAGGDVERLVGTRPMPRRGLEMHHRSVRARRRDEYQQDSKKHRPEGDPVGPRAHATVSRPARRSAPGAVALDYLSADYDRATTCLFGHLETSSLLHAGLADGLAPWGLALRGNCCDWPQMLGSPALHLRG